MPELPEVESAARYLDAQITGRTFLSLEWLHPSVQRGTAQRATLLIGRRVQRVRRVAKFQEIVFEGGAVIMVHFRMTGDWTVTDTTEMPRHARARLSFSENRHVWLVDPRALARIDVRESGEMSAPSRVGPDALDAELDGRTFRARLAARRAPIKQVLLDQSVIAGVGNIYAAEALWKARIHPATPARQLSHARVERLLDGVRWTMARAFEQQGRHQYGTATDRFTVYDREGEPCQRCGSPIARTTQAQRSTYWCRRCQRS